MVPHQALVGLMSLLVDLELDYRLVCQLSQTVFSPPFVIELFRVYEKQAMLILTFFSLLPQLRFLSNHILAKAANNL